MWGFQGLRLVYSGILRRSSGRKAVTQSNSSLSNERSDHEDKLISSQATELDLIRVKTKLLEDAPGKQLV
jgi:hypothetical protein